MITINVKVPKLSTLLTSIMIITLVKYIKHYTDQ